jgi:hypothetical protein
VEVISNPCPRIFPFLALGNTPLMPLLTELKNASLTGFYNDASPTGLSDSAQAPLGAK